MSTPRYDKLIQKIRDWSLRKNAASLPDTVIEDCLAFGLDDIYRELRIPQLEHTELFTITEKNNMADKFTTLPLPQDTIEFVYLRNVSGGVEGNVYNTIPDIRTFLDQYAEQYTRHRMVIRGRDLLISPKLALGEVLELHYYRRLPKLDALYEVVPENYNFEEPYDEQTLLEEVPLGDLDGTPLFLIENRVIDPQAFLTLSEAQAEQALNGGTLTTRYYVGREAWNWFKDANYKLTITASLAHLGRYLQDEKLEMSNTQRAMSDVALLNKEEKFRKARGGNVQININGGGLI
jgi:hypothetical protein